MKIINTLKSKYIYVLSVLISINTIMVEKERIDKDNYENFMSDKALENYKEDNKKCTLFINYNGTRRIW